MSADDIFGPLIDPTPGEVSGKPTASSQNHSHSRSASNSTNPCRRNSPTTPPSPSQRPVHNEKKSPQISIRPRATSDDSNAAFPAYLASPNSTSPNSANSSPPLSSTGRPRRSSSLRERYPGDTSHRPLATLTRDAKLADRAPHLRKKHIHGADSVDQLDDATAHSYHHAGPYDAASLARNNSYDANHGVGHHRRSSSSPLAALNASNHEALRATPRERIRDAVVRHRPLDGVAETPPGVPDKLGRVYRYREGTDLMIEEGNYKRWPGLDYLPEDLKGKGEPSYSIEKALKEHKIEAKRRTQRSPGLLAPENDGSELELLDSRRRSHDSALSGLAGIRSEQPHNDWEQNRGRSGSGTGARISGEFKRRFGSLRKRNAPAISAGVQ